MVTRAQKIMANHDRRSAAEWKVTLRELDQIEKEVRSMFEVDDLFFKGVYEKRGGVNPYS